MEEIEGDTGVIMLNNMKGLNLTPSNNNIHIKVADKDQDNPRHASESIDSLHLEGGQQTQTENNLNYKDYIINDGDPNHAMNAYFHRETIDDNFHRETIDDIDNDIENTMILCQDHDVVAIIDGMATDDLDMRLEDFQ